jgi:hypothetical protein
MFHKPDVRISSLSALCPSQEVDGWSIGEAGAQTVAQQLYAVLFQFKPGVFIGDLHPNDSHLSYSPSNMLMQRMEPVVQPIWPKVHCRTVDAAIPVLGQTKAFCRDERTIEGPIKEERSSDMAPKDRPAPVPRVLANNSTLYCRPGAVVTPDAHDPQCARHPLCVDPFSKKKYTPFVRQSFSVCGKSRGVGTRPPQRELITAIRRSRSL